MSVKLSDNRGFTFIEMLMTMCIISILAHITGMTYFDYRQKAFNTRALADGRNLATVISNSLVDDDDADYTHSPGDGGDIGVVDMEGNPRPKLFGFSEGVEGRVIGNSGFYAGGQGYLMA
ncbi:MAG: prepilin-type N-terminal cleavage/methylation domain-containing protein, partial [Desulfobacterales bacterium]|nr:prepilin-type N-terminal cleavage/methylation domain-containing protein [Desulfobacterales bacterium]